MPTCKIIVVNELINEFSTKNIKFQPDNIKKSSLQFRVALPWALVVRFGPEK